jgi:5-methyltetrahydropteroyltriglutamate--homocysteine methyltransferase
MMFSESVAISTLGFPRIGPRRELKTALENFWSGKSDQQTLLGEAARLRAQTWALQQKLGVTHIPSNDFSLYDHVLDTSVMVGVIPETYGWSGSEVSLATYFAMARGTRGDPDDSVCAGHGAHDEGVPALEMTKWFDTNYHSMVPEFTRGQVFSLASTKPLDEFLEAKALGIHTRPVLVGPVTYLKLGKSKDKTFDPLSLLPALLPVYGEILQRLRQAGADWIQIDEPALVLDLDNQARNAAPGLKLLLTTYFGAIGDNLETALRLPIAGLHLDLVRGAAQLDEVVAKAPAALELSLGVIDGRNVWRTALDAVLDRIEPVAAKRIGPIMRAPSCSLLHVPVDLEREDELDPDLKSWLAFAVQKVEELATLGIALSQGRKAVKDALECSAAAAAARKSSSKIHNLAVQKRTAAISADLTRRCSGFPERQRVQQRRLALPTFPTTTIGSFPQTEEVRKARSNHMQGTMSDADYEAFLRQHTAEAIHWQEEIGLDVLVHGEFERNDMVQYFGEQLSGFAFTKSGWVQSYGSRCVRPPIIFGDVCRPNAMTVKWALYAQAQTNKPMKAMLTGPITMLQWSFVRDDLRRRDVCRQTALALRDEVSDLEKAGIGIIQIDEAAMREGLPLRKCDWQAYLDWATECFRLTSSGVSNGTQIHTHMCYSDFNDIIGAIGALDADVISIETARSKMELLDAFATYRYPNEIGPGVYDIHAPRCPSVDEITALLDKASQRLAPEQIWVNPDCGLKTRKWEEVRPALVNMVEAAKRVRHALR